MLKSHLLFVLAVLMVCSPFVVWAADVDGMWTAKVERRDGGTIELTYTFKAVGEALTGTMSTPMGDSEISDGKISGDNISFSVIISPGGNDFKLLYKGKLQGGEIAFTSEREGSGQTREFVAKRAGS